MSAKYDEYENGDFTADEREHFLEVEDKRKKRVRVKSLLLGFVIAFFIVAAFRRFYRTFQVVYHR